jgi:hypothetical protein
MANNGTEYTFKLKGAIDSSFNKVKQSVNDLETKLKSSSAKFGDKFGSGFDKGIESMSKNAKDFGDKLTNLAGDIPIVGDSITSLTSKLGPMGMGITATIGAVTALGTHLISITKDVESVKKAFGGFVNDSKELDIVTAKAKSLKDTFGTSEEELAKAANTISKEFGISAVDAMTKLQQSMIATNGKLELNDINEFATQIKSIGGDANSLLSTMTTSVQQGLFSNKSLDAIKDFGKNIRSGSDSVKQILDSVGKGNIIDKVGKGLMSQQEAYKEIYKDFSSYSLKQQQDLTTLLGGGGESLGARGIQSLANMNGSMEELVKNGGEYAKYNSEAIKLQEELTKQQLKSTNAIAPLLKKFELFTLKLKIGFQEFINPIVGWVQDIGTELGKLFGGVGDWFTTIKITFKPLIFVISLIADRLSKTVKLFVSLFIGLGKLKDFLVNQLSKAFDNIFGENTFNKITNFFNNIINFIGAKWNQLTELFNQSFQMIRDGLEGNFKGMSESFKKAKEAGKELFSMSRKRFGASENGSVSADAQSTNKTSNQDTNATLSNQISKNVNNAASGATSAVNHISINLDSLQKIQNQYLNSSNDVKSLQTQLQLALLQIVNDVNSVAFK